MAALLLIVLTFYVAVGYLGMRQALRDFVVKQKGA
jgi:hypothetical protein